MSFEMKLWRVSGSELTVVNPTQLDQEQRLEDWIEKDPTVLGMQLAVIGRQVSTINNGRIDLLALDRNGNCVILELKRGRTPRDVIGQLLDYASWVNDLNYAALDAIAQKSLKRSIAVIFEEKFGTRIPIVVNSSHSMVVVASELDDSSERIINYLSEVHGLSINAVFFSVFREGGTELLGRAWLRDPEETIEKSEKRKSSPWNGTWFVNVGESVHRNWDDNRQYGFVGAGQGPKYSGPLKKLQTGDRLFAYLKTAGYVGYGEVISEAQPIADFHVLTLNKRLLDLPMVAPRAAENQDSAELSEWVVGVRWLTQYPRDQAKTFKGVFANQNIVCALRDEATLGFLAKEFGIGEAEVRL